jgi:hypothetical protein
MGWHPLDTISGIYAQHHGFFFYLKSINNSLGVGPAIHFAFPNRYAWKPHIKYSISGQILYYDTTGHML